MSKLYGIGVGPGDEKLLTLRAVEALEMLDVLLVPKTKKGKEGVAEQIVKKYLRADLIVEYADFPMVMDQAAYGEAGEKAAEIIERHIGNGLNVGFVTLGDPGVYSTFGYIVKAVGGRVEIETIPGVTSFCAAAAMANTPLVERDEIFSIIPMNASDERIGEAAFHSDASVFMKLYKREERLIRVLEELDEDRETYFALRCGFADGEIKRDAIEALKSNEDYLTVVHSRKKRGAEQTNG